MALTGGYGRDRKVNKNPLNKARSKRFKKKKKL